MTKTAKKNARFRRMTKAEQRVAIARDALAWLKAGALKAQEAVYLHPQHRGSDSYREDIQARDVYLGHCEVCALGAIMVAKAVRFDGVSARLLAHGSPGEWRDNLAPYFDRDELHEIEHAFECWDGAFPAAYQFGMRFVGANARLTAILENIIAHGGTFRPEAQP